MAVTYGFYNALNHDRLYDAIQMSSIFDGIIRDGIFSTIGESLVVKAPEDGLYVNVGAGRAWFNHSWTLNDTDYPIEAEEAEVVLDRIDAVILEVNNNEVVRANTIKFLKGTPSSNPVRPTLTHNAEVNQYALAYVNIRAGQTTIFQSDITSVVGTDETPFVTGILQQVSIENLILQWEAEFRDHFANWVATNESEYETWSSNMQAQYTAWMNTKISEYRAWFSQMQAEGDEDLTEFDAWFQHMKDQLDTDAAGHLQAEIDALALSAEKGSVVTVSTINTSLYGRTVTISQGANSRTATFNDSGVAVFESIPYVGTVTVSSTDGTQTAESTLNIPYFGRYSVNIAFWAAIVNISTTSSEFYNKEISVAKDGTTIDSVTFSNSGSASYIAMSPGLYTFNVNYEGSDFSSTINVTEETTYNVILNAWTATISISTSLTNLYGRTITVTKGGITVGTTAFDSSGNATYKVHEIGTYTISSTDSDGKTYTKTVNVTTEQAYNVTIGTVTKTITVYGAAGATISFTDTVGSKTVTLNNNGKGSASITFIPPSQSITFTDTNVAKNPDNLSQNYSKAITITESTTAIYVMPNRAVYWYGYSKQYVTYDQPYSGDVITFNTNNVTIATNAMSQGGYYYSGVIFNKKIISSDTKLKMIGKSVNSDVTYHNMPMGSCANFVSENILQLGYYTYNSAPSTANTLYTYDLTGTNHTNRYPMFGRNGGTGQFSALWLE